MKKILIILMVLVGFIANATNYYVKTTGSDSNTGLSDAQAWATLTKVNSVTYNPGDSIFLNNGDSWIETLIVTASGTSGSPIVYGAYGTGDKPKIYGSEVITGWTLHSGNIYKATLTTDITQIFVDGVKMEVARLLNTEYPYNIVTGVTSTTQFTASGMPSEASNYYVGAKVILRTELWYSILRTVTASTGNTLTINSAPSGTLDINEGFIILNKLEFLDSAGEWFYDTATKIVYLWTPNGDSPSNYEIRGSTIDDGVQISTKNYITVKDLKFLHQQYAGIDHSGTCNYISILNNDFEGQDSYGIELELSPSNGIIVSNNTFDRITRRSIWTYNTNNSTFDNNIITNIGLLENWGLVEPIGDGMYVRGKNNTIEYNRVINIGYNGIFWAGVTGDVSNSILQYNFIQNACLSKGDGGAIYTGGITGAGSTVKYNIIDNVVGPKEGGLSTRNFGEGIYIDEPALNIIVEYNTVTNCSNSGIKLHKGENHTIRYNTIMGARQCIEPLLQSGTVPTQITYNIAYSTSATDDFEPRQLLVKYSSANATFDYNTYINHYASAGIFRNSSYYDFAGWKTLMNTDANSTIDVSSLGAGETDTIFYNILKDTKTYNVNTATAYNAVTDAAITTSFDILPFESIIVRGTDLNQITLEPDPTPLPSTRRAFGINGKLWGINGVPFGIREE